MGQDKQKASKAGKAGKEMTEADRRGVRVGQRLLRDLKASGNTDKTLEQGVRDGIDYILDQYNAR